MTYDIEIFIIELQGLLQSDLNSKLSALDTEKNDGIILLPVGSSGYFIQTMDDAVANFDPFIYIGIDDVESVGIGPATSNKFLITVALILADAVTDIYIWKRMMRYQRALVEVLQNKYATFSSHPCKVIIKSLVPISFRLLDSTQSSRAIGCQLEVKIA